VRSRIPSPRKIAEAVGRAAAGGIFLVLVWIGVMGPTRSRALPLVPDDLIGRDLLFPVPAVSAAAMSDGFSELRGARMHEAVDILAPRGSAVVAVDDGTLARLLNSPAGGISVYQFDPAERYYYFYAHLERYVAGLVEGEAVKRGQTIAYVGTSGNAPPNTPHLHFAIAEVTTPKHWWGGRPINPYPLWRGALRKGTTLNGGWAR
jgi:murein DD-endopeptidase MepM/ murein hydrolase activator NlpD